MPFISKDEYGRLWKLAIVGQHAEAEIVKLKTRIQELKDELKQAQVRCDREQARADSALHGMVARVTGMDIPSGPVIPSQPDEDIFAEDPDVVEEIRTRIRRDGAIAVLEGSLHGAESGVDG